MPLVCEHVDGSGNGTDGVVSTGHKRGGSKTGSADLMSARHGGESSRNSADFSPETDSSKADVSCSVRFVASSDSKTEPVTSPSEEAETVRCGGTSSKDIIILEECEDEEGPAVVAASVQPNFCLSERASAFSIAALLQIKQRHSLTRTSADDDDVAAHAPPSRTKRIRLRNSTENDRTSGIEINRRRMKLSDSTSNAVTTDTGMVPAAVAGAALAPSHPDSPLHLLSDGCRSDGVIICRSSVVSADAADASTGAELKKGGCGHEGEETVGVVCQLESKELWNRFHELGTEMIITKSGRRMFPVLSVSFSGLVPDETYLVATDMVPVDNKRYRYTYHRSAWLVAGRADPQPATSGLHVHPDCPMTGRQLNRHAISFERIKLTNSTSPNTLTNKSGHIVLASMHKYQPRIHLIRRSAALALSVAEDKASSSGLLLLQNLRKEHYRTFTFPETEFIAVTAYQNQMITKLKIDSNPFAKGFRDSTRLTDLEREGYPCSVGEFDGFKDLLSAPFPNPSPLFPGSLSSSSSSSSSHNSLPMQKMLQDASSKTHPDHPTRSSAFNHVHTPFLSSSIAETSFDFPSMPSSSVSKLTTMNSLQYSLKLPERKSPSWYDQHSCDRNTMDNRLPVSNAETRQQAEIYRMISLLPRSSISQLSTTTDLAMSPVAMAAANSFYALRYHPYLAASTIAKLHSNSLQS